MTLGIGINTPHGSVMIYDMYAPDPRWIGRSTPLKDKLYVQSYENRMKDGLVLGIAGEFSGERGFEFLYLLQRAYRTEHVADLINENYEDALTLAGGETEEYGTLCTIRDFVESTQDSPNHLMVGTFDGKLFEVTMGKLSKKHFVIHGSGRELVQEYVEKRYRRDMTIEEATRLSREAMDIALRHKPDARHSVYYRGYTMRVIGKNSIQAFVDPRAESVDFEKNFGKLEKNRVYFHGLRNGLYSLLREINNLNQFRYKCNLV